MKKDIKWLKSEVEKQDIVMDKGYIYTNDLIHLIDSLDEPKELSRDLPVIPKIVADLIEEYMAKGFDLYRTLNVLEGGANNLVKIYRWYRNNTLEFTTAYLTKEYKVDEIRYHVRVPYSKLHYYFIDNGCTGAARLFEIDENHSDFELTEDEIYKYLPDISKGYWEEIK